MWNMRGIPHDATHILPQTNSLVTTFILCQHSLDIDSIIVYNDNIKRLEINYMKIIGERIKQLREGAGLSQMKIGALNGYNQSNLARYELGKATPPLKMLLWYADYFDVSMDFIFGRTDNPQGKLYDYNPKISTDSAQLRQFIEMCFDPNSMVSGKLKSTMMEIFLKESDNP